MTNFQGWRTPSSIFLLCFAFLCLFGTQHGPMPVGAHSHGHSHRHLVHRGSEKQSGVSRALSLRESSLTAGVGGQGDYTCGPDRPCYNGACCGEGGWCGYSPKYCGTGCQSNCDAKAECGEYAATVGASCPLNVCCSEFGFCGTTSEFCNAGCQSNCKQPKPSGPPSNVQKRVIGYWEAWNMQHPCGNMNIGQIPVNMLTHLNVAFAYISQDFAITNMDGVSLETYRNIGNLKSRNPNLKIVISLGGWAFSDPGSWRNVFPTMVSSKKNRAAFIQNLLGFLSEYGYDGVDLDWEYPGAEDRGGSKTDANNYVALLTEMREAINRSGRSYIVTFTAPTSYWYLRNFDIKGMEPYVDWINVMSYDLHGVWDKSNPIGNHVLAHTNLTEISLAFDLFWRAEVAPSNLVLGLAFYGRTFKLESSACWRPGCLFSGPGDAGQCTGTPGILSYREIQDLLRKTGADSYLDDEAAVRYLVYGEGSWISFDDDITFQAKIDWANKLGLSGLMIWAVDLDDSKLTALRAVTNSEAQDEIPFSLVDLKYLFPKEDLPAPDTKPSYGLITFGSAGDMSDPSPRSGPFGFLLIASDSHAVSSLRRRAGEPEPFVFLDCPSDLQNQPKNKVQKARVACFSKDLKGCFGILEKGVEGTVVEMPDNCGKNSFARAISLELSADQYISAEYSAQGLTSAVYDFTFDRNLGLMRRDTNNTRIRLDYSNAQNYWDAIVDSPGIQSRHVGTLEERFFAPDKAEWTKKGLDFEFDTSNGETIQKDIGTPLFWQTVDDCDVSGSEFSEGVGVYVDGTIDAKLFYGFSLIANLRDRELGGYELDVTEAHGFLKTTGQTDLTYGIGGVGNIDISRAGKGNPAFYEQPEVHVGGMGQISPGASVWVTPYYKVIYQLATINGSTGGPSLQTGAAQFNGRMSSRVITDLGNFQVNFPTDKEPPQEMYNDKRHKNRIAIPGDNILYGSSAVGGQVAIGTFVNFGLKIDISFFGVPVPDPKLEIIYNTMGKFSFYPGDGEHGEVCADYDIITDISQSIENADVLGWEQPTYWPTLAADEQVPSDGKVCYKASKNPAKRRSDLSRKNHHGYSGSIFNDTSPTNSVKAELFRDRLESRQTDGSPVFPGWGYDIDKTVQPSTYFGAGNGLGAFDGLNPKFSCSDCIGCDLQQPHPCCGCVCMDCRWGTSDIPGGTLHTGWPGSALMSKRQETDSAEHVHNDTLNYLISRKSGEATISAKKLRVCKVPYEPKFPYTYPSFPQDASWPWENIQRNKWDAISRYWGNSSSACQNWGVTSLQPADTLLATNSLGVVQRVRANYETEHPLEGQLISDFFDQWLDQGAIKKQTPVPSNPSPKVPCSWSEQWMTRVGVPSWPWQLRGANRPTLIAVLSGELGCQDKLERLAIFLKRPNMKKGNVFKGASTVDATLYKNMNEDEQLQEAKELGMIFNYMNSQEVWGMFCLSYEGIYDRFGEFDAWYSQHGQGVAIPSLQSEWKSYMRVVLDSAVLRSRAEFDLMYTNKRNSFLLSGLFYRTIWFYNYYWNRRSIRIARQCQHMDASTV